MAAARGNAIQRVFPTRQPIPKQSWSLRNLYDLWHMSNYGAVFQRVGRGGMQPVDFTDHSQTRFWIQFHSRRATKKYHAPHIREKMFRKRFVPSGLPPIESEDVSLPSVPLNPLFYAEVEKRLDTAVFRSCLIGSLDASRAAIKGGKVFVNGYVTRSRDLKLSPGDLVSVEPSAVTSLDPRASHRYNSHSKTELSLRKHLTRLLGLNKISLVDAHKTDAEDLKSNEGLPVKVQTPFPFDKENRGSLAHQFYNELCPKPGAIQGVYSFALPPFATAHLFVPEYLEVSWPTCSFIYVRDPKSGVDSCEIPTPFHASGPELRYTWRYYQRWAPRAGRRVRTSHTRRIRWEIAPYTLRSNKIKQEL